MEWKWRLVRGLYERGYERQDILNLFHFIDWLMDLPGELELEFEEKVKAYEEAKQMPYISRIEQRAIQRGLEQGLEQGLRQKAREDIIDILKVRFGEIPPALVERINDIPHATTLNELLKQAVISDSVAAFEQYIAANVPNGRMRNFCGYAPRPGQAGRHFALAQAAVAGRRLALAGSSLASPPPPPELAGRGSWLNDILGGRMLRVPLRLEGVSLQCRPLSQGGGRWKAGRWIVNF